jgi:hypothetical protein
METQKNNDLFFTCSLIEYIARKTKNTKREVVDRLGKESIKKIYELAEVYHSENIEKVSDEFIESAKINEGDYDMISVCEYRVPSFWELGRIYQRLIVMVDSNEENYIDTLIDVLSSWIIEKIDNYNSSMYYESPQYLYACYKEGEVL